jgi:hypothetical protein
MRFSSLRGTRTLGRLSLAGLIVSVILTVVGIGVIGQIGARAAQTAPSQTVTDEQAHAFATDMLAAINQGDATACNALIDWDAILAKTTAGVEAPDEFRQGFNTGAKKQLGNTGGPVGMIVAQASKGGSYKLLRVRKVDGHKTALFRLTLPSNGGVNYHEFILDPGPGGKAVASDFYIYFSGEPISQTLRRGYMQASAEQNRGLLARLVGADHDFIQNLSKLTEMRELHAAGKDREALAVYNQLPASLQKDKTYLLLRLQITQKLDEAEYSASIEKIRATFPKDACIEFLSIDGFTILKQYDKAIESIDRLDKAIGGDPYLQVLRAGVYLNSDHPEKAVAAARAGVKELPDLIDARWSLVTALLKVDDNDGVLEALKQIDQHFKMTFSDMTRIPLYEKFVKSPQYQEWLKYLKEKDKNKDK